MMRRFPTVPLLLALVSASTSVVVNGLGDRERRRTLPPRERECVRQRSRKCIEDSDELLPLPLKVNCGGGEVFDYIADDYFSGGTAVTDPSAPLPIRNAREDDIFYTERTTTEETGRFSYLFPNLLDGTYELTFLFSESVVDEAGDRFFEVLVNKKSALNNFDILEVSGGQVDFATSATHVFDLDGDEVLVEFVALVGDAKVNAIELRNITTYIDEGINCGGTTTVGMFKPDTELFSGGVATPLPPATIANSNGLDRLFFSQREDTEDLAGFSYTLPAQLPRDYTVQLYFSEHEVDSGRLFDVIVNGKTELNNFNILAEAGNINSAVVHEFVVGNLTTEEIVIEFVSESNVALVNGIYYYSM